MHCSIRDAQLNDSAELAGLMVELGYPTTEAEMRGRLTEVFSDTRFKTLVAIVEDRVCGMIGTMAYGSYEHNDWGGRIVALVVSEKVRRVGVGKELVRAAEEDFARRQITRVAVNTQLTRKEAHQFYEALGYEKNGWRLVKKLSARRD